MQISNGLTQMITTQTGSASRAEAPAETPGSKVDANKLQFKLMFEVVGDGNSLARKLASSGWSAGPITVRDCSHESSWDTTPTASYARILSPMMTIAGGGLDQLEAAMKALQAANVSPGKTGAMRLYVQRTDLDDKATNNLIKTVAGHEDILYRLGQNGGVGRELRHKMNYSHSLTPQLPNVDRLSAAQWASTLSSHYNCVNAETAGMWEFRYLDSSTDAAAVAANIRLTLGMVKAAIEDRVPVVENAAANGCASIANNAQIDRKRWNALMSAAGMSPDSRAQLESQFRSSGGNLQKALLPESARGAHAQLVRDGARFATPEGKLLGSVTDIEDQLDRQAPIVYTTGDGRAIKLSSEQFPVMLSAAGGASQELTSDVRDSVTTAAALTSSGLTLKDSQTGTTINPTEAGVLASEDGRVTVAKGDNAVVLGAASGLSLASLKDLAQGNTQGLSTEQQALPRTIDFLRERGATFSSGDKAIDWTPAAMVNLNGLKVTLPGGATSDIRSASDLFAVAVPVRLESVAADRREVCAAAMKLAAERGMSFSSASSPTPPAQHDPLAQIDLLEKCPADLHVKFRDAKNPTPLPSAGHLDLMVAAENGETKKLDKKSREALKLVDELRDKGFVFFNKRGEDEINSRAGVPLTLHTDGHILTMRVPGSKRRTPVGLKGLRNVALHLAGKHDEMDDKLRQVAEAGEALTHGTYKFQMKDLVKEGEFIDCSVPELIATASRGRTIRIASPDGNVVDADGSDAFLATTRQMADVERAVTAEQAASLTAMQQLIDEHQIVTVATVEGRDVPIEKTQQLPWLLHQGADVKVLAASHVNVAASGGPDLSVHLRGWGDVDQLVADETRPADQAGAHAQFLTHISTLRAKGVQFFHVKGQDHNLPLNNSVVDQIGTNGVKARLPQYTMWNWMPRKWVTVSNEEELARLAGKFTA